MEIGVYLFGLACLVVGAIAGVLVVALCVVGKGKNNPTTRG